MKEVLSVKGVFERTRAREGDRAVSAREDKTATNTLHESTQKICLFSFLIGGAQLTAGLGVLVSLNTYSILLGTSSLALVVSGSPPTRLSPIPALPQPLCNDKKETTMQQKRPTIQQKRHTTKQKIPGATTPEVQCCSSSRARQTPSCQQDRPATLLSLTSLTLTPLTLNFFCLFNLFNFFLTPLTLTPLTLKMSRLVTGGILFDGLSLTHTHSLSLSLTHSVACYRLCTR
jgi:hypothetical protein